MSVTTLEEVEAAHAAQGQRLKEAREVQRVLEKEATQKEVERAR
jgi:hypothetical protein